MPKVFVLASEPRSLMLFRGELLKELCNRRHEVHVVAPDIVPTLAKEFSDLGITCHEIPLNRRDLTHLGTSYTAVVCFDCSKWKARRCIFIYHKASNLWLNYL